MSIAAAGPSLIESLLQHDRPAAWWGLDADPLLDDSGNGYVLTALGTPTGVATLHTRGDATAGGARDFNGTTGGYTTASSVTTAPEGPPSFHASQQAVSTTSNIVAVVSPGGILEGDLMLVVLQNNTATATISSAPAGWTQVNTTLNAGTHAAAIYKRTATSADLTPTEYRWTWSVSNLLNSGMLVYRGLDTSVSGLIFDSNRQVTASGTFHSTTTETFPDGARQLVVWTKFSSTTNVDYDIQDASERLHAISSHLQFWAVDYEQVTAGSDAKVATTTTATTLGAFVLTFGAPRKVLDSTLATIASNITIHALVNPDTIAAGTRTIVRKHQSWGLNVVAAVLTFVYRDGGGVDRTISGPSLTAGTTHRIWVYDDGTNINFVVNGNRTTTARTGTAGYTLNSNTVTIGHYNSGSTVEFFNGRIDELAIFPAAFSIPMWLTHERAATTGVFGDYVTADKSGRYPRAKLEIAIDSQPTATCHVFTDVTTDVRSGEGITYQRGRNFELDRMQAGTMGFVLDNRDRSYDDLLPTRVVRFRCQVATDGPVIPRFFGYTDAPVFRRPAGGTDSTVVINATDIFKALSLDKIRDVFVRPTEFAGVRIAAVLEPVTGLITSLDTGVHNMIGDDLQGVNRLEHCQSIAESDGGVFFADGRGRAIFQDNQYRSKNERTVRATYGWTNTSAPLPCKDFEPEVDEGRLFTAASVTPASGNVQRSVSESAALDFFERTKEVTTLHSLDVDALAMADHIAQAYSVPLDRVPSLRLQPAATANDRGITFAQTMWSTVLGHEISHRIKTIEKPIGGAEVSREHFIEGVSESITSNDWLVTFSLSPTELEGKFFIIGTSQIGDANAVIGW